MVVLTNFFRLKRDNFMGKKHTAVFQTHKEKSSFFSTLVHVFALLYENMRLQWYLLFLRRQKSIVAGWTGQSFNAVVVLHQQSCSSGHLKLLLLFALDCDPPDVNIFLLFYCFYCFCSPILMSYQIQHRKDYTCFILVD